MKKLCFFACILICNSVLGQAVSIPDVIYFAGLRLELTNHVQRTLQTEVENIRRNEKYFRMKVDRADLYFPIIERIFEEEGLPDEFKYLALQESSLIPDAVSTSNAVGYWQFKKESAEEVGLRCDHHVDERMNIASASRGAARYLKRNNGVLQNWIYSLLSYNTGLGGVRKEVEDRYIGASTMKITDKMHWYVIRFLAHKIAYENEVGKNPDKSMYLVEYKGAGLKSSGEIAAEVSLSQEEIEGHNKWMLKGKVPNDKEYSVILPVPAYDYARVVALVGASSPVASAQGSPQQGTVDSAPQAGVKNKKKKQVPEIQDILKPDAVIITIHNKLRAVLTRESDSFERIADAANISLENLRLYNELNKTSRLEPGKYYYIQPKRNKALVSEHVVQPGETIWAIAQEYGVRTNAIRKNNRMTLREEVKPGRVLLLRSRLKKGEKPVYQTIPKKETRPALPQEEKSTVVAEKKPVENSKATVETAKSEQSQKGTEPVAVKPAVQTQPVVEIKKVSLPAENKPEPVAEAAMTHMVEQGETLYGLSRMYNVAIDSLKSWNDLSGGLRTGQIIIVGKKAVPEALKTTEPAKQVEHIVQTGETLYRISKLYGKTVEEIMLWNNKTDSAVSVGELLKIVVD